MAETKMKISDLENLINETQDGEVEIRPDGSVVRLNVTELMEKNLRIERERNELLLKTINELRDRLKKIAAIAAP